MVMVAYDDMNLFTETTNAEVIEAFFNILHQDSSRADKIVIAKEAGIIVEITLESVWLSKK